MTNGASSVAVIGGADGPTAIFVTGSITGFAYFTPLHCLLFAAAILLAYAIGNISPAIVLGKMHGIDIKKEGSGNAGTTNVLRVLGKKAAAATLIIDIFKGVAAVLIGRFGGAFLAAGATAWAVTNGALTAAAALAFSQLCSLLLMLACGTAAFCGHIWPAAFGFKGGKGVATAFGVIVTVKPLLGLVTLLVVLIVAALTRRVSAGSVAGAIAFPFLAWLLNPGAVALGGPLYIGWAVVVAAIVLIKHRANIKRLIRGEEPKINFKK